MHRIPTRLTAVLAVLSLVATAGVSAALATHSNSMIGLLAIDADPEGNAATSLGPLDGCARVEGGSLINVDYVVDSIPRDRPMIAFEAQIRYDPQLLEVVDVDYDLLLAAVGGYSPFAGLSDDLPDTDGSFRISVLDVASSVEPEANVETGTGVLARITFRAKGAGVSEVSIAVETEPLVYPLVQDTQNEMIFVERLGSASVAVGQDCPAQALQPKIDDLAPMNEKILAANPDLRPDVTPAGGDSVPASSPTSGSEAPFPASSATPFSAAPGAANTADDQDGSNTSLMGAAVILLALGAAGVGGWYLFRHSRNSSRS